MADLYSPFSKAELLPQEETLEVLKSKKKLFIGIPKETQFQEQRVCLTPSAVSTIVNNGHEVLIEANAGKGANFEDKDYTEAGAEITRDQKKVFACPVLLKVEPPTAHEIDLMTPQTLLISALQLKTQKSSYFKKLAEKRISALAFEFMQDQEGNYPAVKSMSEIAGIASILIASELLSNANGGKGIIMGNITGVPPVEVLVLGAGTVGEFAVKSALGLGATVKLFDNSLSKLKRVKGFTQNQIYTSTLQPQNLAKSLIKCDIAIGALRGKTRSPSLVTEEMVNQMKPGSVIIDISIDMGGCFETSEITSHHKPTIIKNGIIHYGVPNIPARYSRTASMSISNILTPFVLEIGEQGGLEKAIRINNGLKYGMYYYKGILTNRAISDWFQIPYRDINLLIF